MNRFIALALLVPGIAAIAACSHRRPAAPPPAPDVIHTTQECIDILFSDTTPVGARAVKPPVPRSLALPPLPVPTALQGQRITLRFYVSTAGTIDVMDVMFPKERDDVYEVQLTEAYKNSSFYPAMYRGCPIAGRVDVPVQLP